ncbi:MAG: hypothetical protein DRI24_13330 [Deltaproteobacteria bacterium]|nr:MAG: hypothetical protein DRI24_13330 [Deltaproteobacteria bacterium]
MSITPKSIRTSTLRMALSAAIEESKIPFYIYDASFFGGEGILEGDWTVISENRESEYAIVIEQVVEERDARTIAGIRKLPVTVYKVHHPLFEEGDSSVGLEEAWVIGDFDPDVPERTFTNVTDTAIHVVNWFLNREMAMRIDNILSANEFQDNHFMNHPIGLD